MYVIHHSKGGHVVHTCVQLSHPDIILSNIIFVLETPSYGFKAFRCYECALSIQVLVVCGRFMYTDLDTSMYAKYEVCKRIHMNIMSVAL